MMISQKTDEEGGGLSRAWVSDGSINIPSGANTITNCSESNSNHMKGKFEVQRFFIITLQREIAKLQKKENKK